MLRLAGFGGAIEHMDEPRECKLAALPLLCTDIREASETLEEADESGGGEPARATCVGEADRGGAKSSSSCAPGALARGRFLASLLGVSGGAHSSGVSRISSMGAAKLGRHFRKLPHARRALAAAGVPYPTSRPFWFVASGVQNADMCAMGMGVRVRVRV